MEKEELTIEELKEHRHRLKSDPEYAKLWETSDVPDDKIYDYEELQEIKRS